MNTETPVIGSSLAPPPLVFTDAAARKVGELIQEEDNPDLMLRVFVSGGGCSGFQYGFTFDEQIEDGDSSVVNQGVTLIVGQAFSRFHAARPGPAYLEIPLDLLSQPSQISMEVWPKASRPITCRQERRCSG